MANENVIQMINVTKKFGDFVANDKINLELKKVKFTPCSVKMVPVNQL